MDREAIMQIIPHRPPFLLLDEIITLEPGLKVTARKLVREDEDYFRGHFPGNPVMPGVLIIEALAQAGAAAILALPENKGKTGYFAGIDKARFKRKVIPGDVLTLEAEIVKYRRNVGLGHGIARVGDEVAAYGDFTFAIG